MSVERSIHVEDSVRTLVTENDGWSFARREPESTERSPLERARLSGR
jgi:hypothetical protein